MDPNTIILGLDYTGLSEKATLDSGWQLSIHPDDRDEHLNKWQASLATGAPFENEARQRDANGEYRWFLVRAVPLCDGHGLPKVTADRVQLQQVLMNLMLNGIEAMKDTAGELKIESELSKDGQLLISVSDTGVGLPAEKTDQIFQPFFTTKPQGPAWAWRSAAP